ncbi:MAG: 16S rRNA (cytidine(1402)-2'-O)-methyltransferase [Christensenellales bacterium]|jgi:16S rRNA (cytidine1402-2'-O)-methyltransferase
MARLYVVATPIGNLSDMTARMREALDACDLVAAEDTRVTLRLLSHLEIKKPLVSCHRHNERQRAPQLIERMLAENLTVALTCDAGTPAISDPGNLLVAAAWEAGIPVTPIVGPSAVTAALSASGFDAREFAFYGFLPREAKPLREKLAAIRASGVPIAVLYESPHRIKALVGAIAQAWQGCELLVGCDITKKYELLLRGTADEVLRALEANPNAERGEYCVVARVPEPLPVEPSAAGAAERMLHDMLGGMSLNEAAQRAADAGFARNEIYKIKLEIKRRFGE